MDPCTDTPIKDATWNATPYDLQEGKQDFGTEKGTEILEDQKSIVFYKLTKELRDRFCSELDYQKHDSTTISFGINGDKSDLEYEFSCTSDDGKMNSLVLNYTDDLDFLKHKSWKYLPKKEINETKTELWKSKS